MNIQNWLIIIGSIGGVLYFILGLVAATEKKEEEIKKFIFPSGIWSLSFKNYNEAGQKLCKIGNIFMAIYYGSWISLSLMYLK